MALRVPLVPGQTASNRMNQVRQQQRLAKGGKVKRYATGGQVPRSGKTDMWIDNIPVDQYQRAFSADRNLEIKPKSTNTDDTTGPQPSPKWMENRKGGKVKRVLKRKRA
jgi:hypothetical protein